MTNNGTAPGDCIHCGKEICNDLGWCNSYTPAPIPATPESFPKGREGEDSTGGVKSVDPRDLWFAEWQLVLPRDACEAWPGGQCTPGVDLPDGGRDAS